MMEICLPVVVSAGGFRCCGWGGGLFRGDKRRVVYCMKGRWSIRGRGGSSGSMLAVSGGLITPTIEAERFPQRPYARPDPSLRLQYRHYLPSLTTPAVVKFKLSSHVLRHSSVACTFLIDCRKFTRLRVITG
jgi:hypothetical protein